MNGEKVLDISWGTIAKISVAVLIMYVIYLIRDILVWFIFALIISILFNPAIDFLHKRRIPRILSASFVYVTIFGGLVLFLYSTSSIFIDEIQEFSKVFPKYFEQISPVLSGAGVQAFTDTESFIRTAHSAAQQIGANIFNALFIIFGGIFSALFVISVAFFLSLEQKTVENSISLLFPARYEETVFSIWGRAQKKVNNWFLGRIIASLFVGLASYLTLFLFNVNYPISLAVTAAVLNFVPIIGPIAAGFLIFVIVSLDSPTMALLVILAFTLIQQIENNILTPALTKKLVGVSPALVLLALAIGGKLWGLMGAILVVPLIGIVSEFISEFLSKQRSSQSTGT